MHTIYIFPNASSSTADSVKTSSNQKKVLILGAGRTSGSVIEYLNRNKDYTVTIGNYHT